MIEDEEHRPCDRKDCACPCQRGPLTMTLTLGEPPNPELRERRLNTLGGLLTFAALVTGFGIGLLCSRQGEPPGGVGGDYSVMNMAGLPGPLEAEDQTNSPAGAPDAAVVKSVLDVKPFPPHPLKGQRRPPCGDHQRQMLGGCWRAFAVGYSDEEAKRDCKNDDFYAPSFEWCVKHRIAWFPEMIETTPSSEHPQGN